MNQVSRIDLHVHTRFSKDADDFLLGALGAQECYSTPQQVYDLAIRRGMDFVTITDHDTINGALEIAHLDHVIVSEEITAYFPEDGAKLHVVALNINEAQHEVIKTLRKNVLELIQYLNSEGIVHFVAHPFFRMGPPLTLKHFEKMLLLFKRFEVKNGGKQTIPDNLIHTLLQNLTEDTLWHLANKYDIEPAGIDPWIKYSVAGSDDHGGILIGNPHTATLHSDSTETLMKHIRDGHTKAVGEGGTPLAVAHSIFSVAYHHLQKQSCRKNLKSRMMWNVLGQFFDNANPERSLHVSARMLFFLNEQLDLFGRFNVMTSEFAELMRMNLEWRKMLRDGLDFNFENNENLFDFLSTWIHGSISRVAENMEGNPDINFILMHLKALRPVLPVFLIYMIAFKTETRDRPLMRKVRQKYSDRPKDYPRTIAVFTDSSSREVVSSLVMKYCRHIHHDSEAALSVFGLSDETLHLPNRENYESIGTIQFKEMKFNLPPALLIVRRMVEQDIEHIYLHSFGPMGLLGLLLGKWLCIPVSCHYPRLKQLEKNDMQPAVDGQIKERIIRLLLRLTDHITVSSHEELEDLLSMNLAPEKIELLQPDHERHVSRSESYPLELLP